jgi:hypothetical protein
MYTTNYLQSVETMKKKLIKSYALFLILVSVLVSCVTDLEEMNVDPNRPKEVYPGGILAQMQYRFVNASIAGARSFTHDIMQVTAPRASQTGGHHRYFVTPASATGLWNNFYSYMTDAEDVYVIAERLNAGNYQAIALIMKSWAYAILTDCFGDIPYSEATKASEGKLMPAFDTQPAIYRQLLTDLERANDLLAGAPGLAYGGDMIYQANQAAGIRKWQKFSNSLRLRLLLRILARDGEIDVTGQINQILANPEMYPLFTDTEDDAIFRYPGNFPFFNPYFNARTLDWREGTYFTEFFINHLNDFRDPRRQVWSTTIQEGDERIYRGIQSGYESHVEYVVNRNSSYNDGLKTLPQLGILMTSAELEFILAELALRGFNTGNTAPEHYQRGIARSMRQWGAQMPADYLENPAVAYPAAAGFEEQLEKIMLQKYFALFFTDYQAWFEKRRTGYPVLPRGAGIPRENQFPSRVMYPTYLQSLNPDNLQQAIERMGGDESSVKVWWEK